ncbi:MAG: hypothetical protein LEGION0398_MBIBDBAK_00119 [Legionellaceae bacterium]
MLSGIGTCDQELAYRCIERWAYHSDYIELFFYRIRTMQKKLFLSAILAATVVLAGCQGNNQPTEQTEATQPATPTDENVAPAASQTPAPEAIAPAAESTPATPAPAEAAPAAATDTTAATTPVADVSAPATTSAETTAK